MKTAFIPGSFNPFTVGHKSLVDRALNLFDRVVVGIGVNADKAPEHALDNKKAIEHVYKDDSRVSVVIYTGLTIDACRQHGARWMVRGIRSVGDMEYERTLADVNRELAGIETVLFFTLPQFQSVSSSVVRDLQSHGADVSRFLP